VFPTFEKGTQIVFAEAEDAEFLGWHECEVGEYKFYVPRTYVCNGLLTQDYNPTELTQEIGDVLEVKAIIGAWLLATNKNEVTGWIPAECVKTI